MAGGTGTNNNKFAIGLPLISERGEEDVASRNEPFLRVLVVTL